MSPEMILWYRMGNTKTRIRNLLNYKEPVFWIVMAALVAVLAVCVGLAVNPRNNGRSLDRAAADLLKYRTEYTGDNSKVGGIIYRLKYPDKVTCHSFELYAEGTPLMVTIKLDTDTKGWIRLPRGTLRKEKQITPNYG